jgi:hypothetical protein
VALKTPTAVILFLAQLQALVAVAGQVPAARSEVVVREVGLHTKPPTRLAALAQQGKGLKVATAQALTRYPTEMLAQAAAALALLV